MTYHSKSSTDEEYLPEDQTHVTYRRNVCVCTRVCARLCLRVKWRYPKRPYQNVPSINTIKGHVQCVPAKLLQLRSTLDPRTAGLQAPLSMGFSRQEYWSGLPFPFPGDLPSPGFEPWSLMSPALAGGFFATSATWEACQVQDFHSVLLHVNFPVFQL